MVAHGTLALLAVALLAAAQPAQAAGGATMATGFAANGANTWAVATATCAGNQQLHGGGAQIIGGGGDVAITELIPSLATNTLTAVGTDIGSTGVSFAVEVYAVCANPTTNLQIVSAESAYNNTDPTKSATPVCPAGQKLYGYGFEVHGPPAGEVFVQEVEPSAGLTSVTVSATVNGGWAGWWEINAWGICGDPTAGMSRVELLTISNSSTSKAAWRSCPGAADVYAVGSELHGGAGEVVLHHFAPTNGFLGTARVEAREHGAYPDDWALKLYAICV